MSSYLAILSSPPRLSAMRQLTEILRGLLLWLTIFPVIPLVQTLVQVPSIYSD